MAACLGVDASGGVKILDADRQPLKRTRLFLGEAPVAGLSHLQRLLRRDSHKRVEPLPALDRLEMSFGEFEAGNRPRLEAIARFGERERGQIGQSWILEDERPALAGHSFTLGTTKKPSSVC